MDLALTSGLPGSIHGHFDGSVVGGHLGRVGEHGDGQCETLPWEEWGIKAGGWHLGPFTTRPAHLPRKPLTFPKGQVSLL